MKRNISLNKFKHDVEKHYLRELRIHIVIIIIIIIIIKTSFTVILTIIIVIHYFLYYSHIAIVITILHLSLRSSSLKLRLFPISSTKYV